MERESEAFEELAAFRWHGEMVRGRARVAELEAAFSHEWVPSIRSSRCGQCGLTKLDPVHVARDLRKSTNT